MIFEHSHSHNYSCRVFKNAYEHVLL